MNINKEFKDCFFKKDIIIPKTVSFTIRYCICGSTPLIHEDKQSHSIGCNECDFSINSNSIQKTILLWNNAIDYLFKCNK